MSVQWGQWNFDGAPVDQADLEKASLALAPYGPDAAATYSEDGVSILYRAFHTTRESRRESQPYQLSSGAILTWDGRVDNRKELIEECDRGLSPFAPDVEIVAACYERWGASCLRKIVGDWALSLWEPQDRSLLLAKDFLGSRSLFYMIEKDRTSWSSVLDPLVLLAHRSLQLDEEYVAGWISFFPSASLTPYVGIHSVPPSHYVRIRNGQASVTEYWRFDPQKRIRYRADGEYEECFRAAFARAVEARLRSDAPVLAELSGGVDSSSIVCMADALSAGGRAAAPRIDTLSCFDDSEPDWDERFYFTLVETQRGKTGFHIDVKPDAGHDAEIGAIGFRALPHSRSTDSHVIRQFASCLRENGNRVVLSGIGGDEVLGGVPTPLPELADLLARLRITILGLQLVAWALARKTSLLHLAAQSARLFLPLGVAGTEEMPRHPNWLNRQFGERYRFALRGYQTRFKFFGPLPSFQENLQTLDALRRQFGCASLSIGCLRETRYPYLDRDLLEFLFAIPREQLVRPRQRRSLMRRALAGLVPAEILNRSRKATVVRGAVTEIRQRWSRIIKSAGILSASLGIVNEAALREAISSISAGRDLPIVPLLRLLALEDWLQYLRGMDVVSSPHWNLAFACRPLADETNEFRKVIP